MSGAQKDLLPKLARLASRQCHGEGPNSTAIAYFEVLKFSASTPLRHGLLKPSFCVILQGQKKLLVGSAVLKYGPGHYLASLLDLPVAGQIIGVTQEKPYLGLRIEYTLEEITSVLLDAKVEPGAKPEAKRGAFTAPASAAVLETFAKLFELLDAPKDIPYLSQLLKKELIYRLLTSDAGPLFSQKTILSPGTSGGISKAVHWLKDHFDQALSVEELAKASHMSVSSLHHKFKTFASMGPLQYQKRLRLHEARRLFLNGDEDDVNSVARRVGYESSSQFSREYRRLFGLPPSQDVKALRKLARVAVDDY